jgi:hypothetical protein
METITAKFKKNQKVKYLDYEGVITFVSFCIYTETYEYSISYNNENSKCKVSNIIEKLIQKA